MGTTTHTPSSGARCRMIRRITDWLGQVLFPGSREVPERGPSEDFLDPYTAGQEFRRQYTDTPLYADSVAATGTDPGGAQ